MAFGWFGKKHGGSAPPGGRPAISSLLSPELVLVAGGDATKDSFIETMIGRLCEVRGLGDPAPFLNRVLEREQGISTTLDTGLAVPHARIDDIDGIAAALGLIPDGIPDPKQPEFTIRAMFLFFSPNTQEHFAQHLQLLRSVASLFREDLIDTALVDPAPEAVLSLLREREAAA